MPSKLWLKLLGLFHINAAPTIESSSEIYRTYHSSKMVYFCQAYSIFSSLFYSLAYKTGSNLPLSTIDSYSLNMTKAVEIYKKMVGF
jgi:hypothetical protein